MTLILTMANQQQVAVVSDRRLTCNGQVKEDESNKAGTLICANARLVFAYTGLAQAGSFLTRRWLPEALMESAAPDFLMGPTIGRFRERATRDFTKIRASRPSDKRLTVVLAGYCDDDTPPRCYCWLVSNFEDIDGLRPPRQEPSEQFSAQYCRDQRPTATMPHLLLVAGVSRAVSQGDIESLRGLLREGKPPEALVGKAVEVLCAAAESGDSDQLIGKQCTSIVLPSDPAARAWVEYHSALTTERIFGTTHIEARGGGFGVYTIADPVIQAVDDTGHSAVLRVPKVGRNYPCPCGSGLKYKKCHGRSGTRGEGTLLSVGSDGPA